MPRIEWVQLAGHKSNEMNERKNGDNDDYDDDGGGIRSSKAKRNSV